MSGRACGRCDELRRALGGCSLNADEAREIAGDALRADASAARCLSERLDEVSAAHNDATDEVRRLTEQRDALLAALERHGEHLVSCAYSALRGTSCTCGLDAAIAKAGETRP